MVGVGRRVWGLPVRHAESITATAVVVGILAYAAAMIVRLVLAIVGVYSGVVPSTDEGGIFGYVPGYPAFDPQHWILFIPALLALFVSVWTIPLSMKRSVVFPRWLLLLIVGTQMLATVVAALSYPEAPNVWHIAEFALPIFALAWVLLLLRSLAGVLRLVPRDWRTSPTTRTRTGKEGR